MSLAIGIIATILIVFLIAIDMDGRRITLARNNTDYGPRGYIVWIEGGVIMSSQFSSYSIAQGALDTWRELHGPTCMALESTSDIKAKKLYAEKIGGQDFEIRRNKARLV